MKNTDLCQHAIKGAGMGIWQLSVPDRTLTWSGKYGTLLKLNPKDNGKPIEDLLLSKVHPDDRFSLEQMIEEVVAGTRTQGAITVRFQTKDDWFYGEILWGVTQRDAGEEVVSCSGTLRDVTEEKAVQEALIAANKKLNALTSITRHDILNQVTVMALYKELVTETEVIPRDIEEWQYLEFIFSAIKTIQQQFAFSKEYQDLGTHPAEWQNVDLILKLTARDPIFESCAITHEDTDNIEIFADPLLAKVLFILLDHLAHHGGKSIVIRTGFEHREDTGILFIEDNGKGVPADQKEKIFSRGYGDTAGNKLYLAGELLAITGITLQETGIEGKGTRFELCMPKKGFRESAPDNGAKRAAPS